VLYAVNEVEHYKGRPTGAVSALAIEEGTARSLDARAAVGRWCALLRERGPSGRALLVANYAGAASRYCRFRWILRSPRPRPWFSTREQDRTPSVRKRRMRTASFPNPSNRFALAADLGADRVFVYRLDLEGRSLRHIEEGDAVMRPARARVT